MKTIPKMLVLGLVELAVFGLMLFLAAGTFNYWQAWVFLVVFALSAWIPGIYLLRTNPAALAAADAWGADSGDPNGAEGRHGWLMVVAGSNGHGQHP